MALTLIVATLLGVAAPFIRGWLWGVPFSLLSIATVLRAFLVTAGTVVIIGVAALFALRATPMDQAEINRVAGLIAGAIALVLLVSSAQRLRDVRGLSVLSQRLQEDDARATAMRSLRKLLERARRKDEQRFIALSLMAVGPLTQAGMWSEARELLRSLDEVTLGEAQAVLRNQALATCELQFDDIEAAEHAIEQINRPAEPSIEVWLVAMEALIMAVRGETEKALGHLGGQESKDNPSLQASHRLVHAHIYAARGDVEVAREELRALEGQAGKAGLERVLKPEGPASDLARELLEQDDQSG